MHQEYFEETAQRLFACSHDIGGTRSQVNGLHFMIDGLKFEEPTHRLYRTAISFDMSRMLQFLFSHIQSST